MIASILTAMAIGVLAFWSKHNFLVVMGVQKEVSFHLLKMRQEREIESETN